MKYFKLVWSVLYHSISCSGPGQSSCRSLNQSCQWAQEFHPAGPPTGCPQPGLSYPQTYPCSPARPEPSPTEAAQLNVLCHLWMTPVMLTPENIRHEYQPDFIMQMPHWLRKIMHWKTANQHDSRNADIKNILTMHVHETEELAMNWDTSLWTATTATSLQQHNHRHNGLWTTKLSSANNNKDKQTLIQNINMCIKHEQYWCDTRSARKTTSLWVHILKRISRECWGVYATEGVWEVQCTWCRHRNI